MTSLLIDYWEKQGIKIAPKTIDEIEYIQKNNKLRMPGDFKFFYSRVNGMGNFYPNETDEEGFLFYPIEAVVSVDKEFVASDLINKGRIFIFSEYMHKSWWYGFEITDDKSYQIGIIPDKDIFVPITSSLADFIDLYLKNSSRLYDY